MPQTCHKRSGQQKETLYIYLYWVNHFVTVSQHKWLKSTRHYTIFRREQCTMFMHRPQIEMFPINVLVSLSRLRTLWRQGWQQGVRSTDRGAFRCMVPSRPTFRPFTRAWKRYALMRDGRVLAASSRLIGVARQRNHLANAKAIRLAVWGSNFDARGVAKWEQTYIQKLVA